MRYHSNFCTFNAKDICRYFSVLAESSTFKFRQTLPIEFDANAERFYGDGLLFLETA